MTQPPRPPGGSGPKQGPRPSGPKPAPQQPGATRHGTTGRTGAPPVSKRPSGPVAVALKNVAEDQALNAVALVKEGWQGFLKTNRFFKFKAAIVGVWLL